MRITPTLDIDEATLTEKFIRAPGPGGQNVNKVETGVQLRFDAARAGALTDAVRARLFKLAGRRVTKEGVIVIEATTHRTRERNREDARKRLKRLIETAIRPPTRRVKTTVPHGTKRKRLEAKKRRGETKQSRGWVRRSGVDE
ncbi:MAG: alternative ribosome rescue aminoacyl-tRNA hydrolase ArfB [Pseudomonadota bacterium]